MMASTGDARTIRPPCNYDIEQPFGHALPAIQRWRGDVNQRQARHLLRVDSWPRNVSQCGCHDQSNVPRRQLPPKVP